MRRLSHTEVARILDYRAQGLTFAEIGERFGRPRSTVACAYYRATRGSDIAEKGARLLRTALNDAIGPLTVNHRRRRVSVHLSPEQAEELARVVNRWDGGLD